jgi:hypothetical protein
MDWVQVFSPDRGNPSLRTLKTSAQGSSRAGARTPVPYQPPTVKMKGTKESRVPFARVAGAPSRTSGGLGEMKDGGRSRRGREASG